MLNCKPVDGGVDSVVGVGAVGAVDGIDNSMLGDVPTGVDVVGTGGVVGTVERKSYIFLSNSKRMLLKTIPNTSQEFTSCQLREHFHLHAVKSANQSLI